MLASPWLVVHPSAHGAARAWLCCLPPSGGSASIFARWIDHLPASIGLLAVEYPGRGSRFAQAPFTRFAPLLDAFAAEVMPSLDRATPLVLFGHSLGASIAFELARRLAADGRPPAALVASGESAPHVPDPLPPMADLPDPAFLAELRSRYGQPVSDEVAASEGYAELLELLLPVVRADVGVYESYRFGPGPRLGCPIIAFLADGDRSIDPAGVEAWRDHTSGPFALERIEGDHWSVLAPEG